MYLYLLYGFAESWILIGRRAAGQCVSGPWSVFSRIRTGFPYVNLTGSNLKRFYTFIRSLCEEKVSLDHF